MPLSKDRNRIYQREWLAKRRAEWFASHGPCRRCGSNENLTLHHKDPSKKVHHAVWSWSEVRRDREIAKCEVLCKACHVIEDSREGMPNEALHGTMGRYMVGCRCVLCSARKQAYWRYGHYRRRAREAGIEITRRVENLLRQRAGYPRRPPQVAPVYPSSASCAPGRRPVW